MGAQNDCSGEPDTQRGRFICAVIARDSLCEDGTVSNETCQNCSQLESYCGPLQLTNETDYCDLFDVEAIQYCPLFRAVNCTGDPANKTEEQQGRCDYCVVIEQECPAPPPSVCYEASLQRACIAAERLEQSYTCTELFPPDPAEDDDGPCLLCEYYELICGSPLGDLDTTLLCDDVEAVVHCYFINITEECSNTEDDPEKAVECAYCSILSEANCNETDLCDLFDEEAIQYCPLILAVNCTGDPANRTEEQQKQCDYCVVIEREECPAPPPSVCYEFGLQLACNAAERLEQNYTCTELFPPDPAEDDDGPCLLCEYYELVCGSPLGEVNTTLLCEDTDVDVARCLIVSMREECRNIEDSLDPEVAVECVYCSIVVEANCTLPPTGTNEICSSTGLEAFCATALGEGLCPGTTFSERTCEDCFYFELACGSPEGAIEDLCDDQGACTEIEPVCTMSDIPPDNITMCEGCDFLAERCPGSTLPLKYPAKILPAQIDTICPSTEEQDIYIAEIEEEISTLIRDTVLPALTSGN